MLKQLLLRNIALVEELSLDFRPGLNVLSGETGAGKSIIIDSVSFLLGGRADRDIIRSGAAKAYVEGVFDISHNQSALLYLEQQELEPEDGSIRISRELNQSGRSTSRVEGVALNLAQLRGLSSLLLDIHGQHDHQSLLDERSHLGYLDGFGDEDYQALIGSTLSAYAHFDALERRLREAQGKSLSRQERQDLLLAQQKELTQLKPMAGEEDSLKAKVDQLRFAGKIKQALERAFAATYGSGRDAQAALSQMLDAKRALDEIASFGDEFVSLRDRMDSLYYETEDLALELRNRLERFESEGDSLEALSARLDQYRRMGRKYGRPGDELPDALEEIEQELDALSSIDEDIQRLEKERQVAYEAYADAADRLSRERQALAESLSRRMEQQLEALNMAGTRFAMQFEQQKTPSPEGWDQVRMLLAPNIGEEPKPLSKIASGGETSRLMLALKSISAEHNLVPTMIFDEIDAGISGRTAQVVAEQLWQIARYRQVLCVTHLQQIAAMASTHFLVEKEESDGRTHTLVREITGPDRIREISRIISGFGEDQHSSLVHAEHMLSAAAEYRSRSGG